MQTKRPGAALPLQAATAEGASGKKSTKARRKKSAPPTLDSDDEGTQPAEAAGGKKRRGKGALRRASDKAAVAQAGAAPAQPAGHGAGDAQAAIELSSDGGNDGAESSDDDFGVHCCNLILSFVCFSGCAVVQPCRTRSWIKCSRAQL